MFLILSLLASAPSIKDTIMPVEYLVCGPFLTGVREGTWRILPDDTAFVPNEGDSLFSVQTTGGWQKWERVKVDSTGWLTTSYPNVGWDTLQDFYGISALYNSAYAYAEINVPARSRALALAMGCSFSINGRGYMGDVYSSGTVQTPVILEEGFNRIWLFLGGAGDDRVSFKLVPIDEDMRIITKDATVPDVVYGDSAGPYLAAVTIVNAAEEWIRDAKLVVEGEDFFKREHTLPPLAPMNFYKAPFYFTLSEPVTDSTPDNSLEVPVKIISSDVEVKATIKIRLRRPDQSRRETFISRIDRSVQYYGLMPPRDYDPAKKYPLIFSLHGAGVEASGQVDAYSQKDWAFIACPTNRRIFGFDWQDWGRLDALEVLDKVKERYPIDEDRVQLTGHSMGGHGTWHVGLTHPDLFASLVPEAGWTNHELYSTWTWQKSAIFAEPWQLEIRNQALRGDNQLARLENAANLPIFILQGGADDNVPAFQARLYAARLNLLGFDYRYVEVPDKPHWWSDSGVACVDRADVIGFMQQKYRPSYPEHVYYRTADLTQENGAYWLSIHSVDDRLRDAVIEGRHEEDTFTITTTNISRFSLKLCETGKPIKVLIDDSRFDITPRSDSIVFERSSRKWQIAGHSTYPLPRPPIKGAYYEPFILVFGTKSDSLTTSRLMRTAVSESQRWWLAANGRTYVYPDTSLTTDMIENYNLVLFGNAEQNTITARIEEKLPVRIVDDRFYIKGEKLSADAVSALFIYPNPLSAAKKILLREGIGDEGLRLSGYFSTLYSGAGLPDYIIWSKEVSDKGWGGVVKAGYFP